MAFTKIDVYIGNIFLILGFLYTIITLVYIPLFFMNFLPIALICVTMGVFTCFFAVHTLHTKIYPKLYNNYTNLSNSYKILFIILPIFITTGIIDIILNLNNYILSIICITIVLFMIYVLNNILKMVR
jgi:hypothetical protein